MPKVRRCRYEQCKRLVPYPNHYCKEHKSHEAEYRAKRNKARQQYLKRYNKVNRNRDNDSRQRYNFYRTREWSQLRQSALERDFYLCQYCLVDGRTTPNSKTVDHIVPVEYDSTLKDDIDNLAVICRKCHKLKTDWEQKYYGTGKKSNLKDKYEIKNIKTIVKMMRQK